MQKKISFGGIAAALTVLSLIFSVYIPTIKVSMLFIASLIIYITGEYTDNKTALIAYVASSAISLLAAAGASPIIVLYFIICFGNYPVIKRMLDVRRVGFRFALKFILYTVYFGLSYAAFLVVVNVSLPCAVWILYVCGVFAFAVYDYVLENCGKYIILRLSKSFNK